MESHEPERSGSHPGESRGKRVMLAGGALFMLIGVVAGVSYLPEEWSWIRRASGGLVVGAGVALMIFAWRLLVFDDEDE